MTTTMTINPREQVRLYREASTGLRTIARNRRLGRYTGRNSDATQALVEHLEAQREAAWRALSEANFRILVGVLVDEDKTALRLSEARDAGQDRVQLQERVKRARAVIRTTLRDA